MKLSIIDRMAYYLGEAHFNEGYIITRDSVKEMIKLVYLDEITDEVLKNFYIQWNIKQEHQIKKEFKMKNKLSSEFGKKIAKVMMNLKSSHCYFIEEEELDWNDAEELMKKIIKDK